MNGTNGCTTHESVKDITSEAERWDDVRTLVLASDTVVVKNLRNSGFARMVIGYLGDHEGDVTEDWDGDDLKIQFGVEGR